MTKAECAKIASDTIIYFTGDQNELDDIFSVSYVISFDSMVIMRSLIYPDRSSIHVDMKDLLTDKYSLRAV